MKVFLDMDGVLVDFRRGVCEIFGIPPHPHAWRFWKDWPNTTNEMVDAVCGREFWEHLHWTKDGQRLLYGWVDIMGKFSDITILTTPMLNADSWTGKRLWIKNNLPMKLQNNIIMLNGPKSQLAKPGTLLIDDKDENIAEFVVAGGQGILVPRPWNELRNWSNESLEVVKNSLEML